MPSAGCGIGPKGRTGDERYEKLFSILRDVRCSLRSPPSLATLLLAKVQAPMLLLAAVGQA
jgi:hypothetical protein